MIGKTRPIHRSSVDRVLKPSVSCAASGTRMIRIKSPGSGSHLILRAASSVVITSASFSARDLLFAGGEEKQIPRFARDDNSTAMISDALLTTDARSLRLTMTTGNSQLTTNN